MNTVLGRRFCVLHEPEGRARGGILHVPAFAEEMNKSRRMVSLQAKAFAKAGYATLVMDLFGCGDSDGLLDGATAEIWLDDIATALKWLAFRVDAPVSVWGLRTGCLLAVEAASRCERPLDQAVFWQPVMVGETFMSQFLRLKVASEMMGGKNGKTTKSLIAALDRDETLQIAGYPLSGALHRSIAEIDALSSQKELPWLKTTWIDIEQRHTVPNMFGGRPVTFLHVEGQPFWKTQEISECSDLVDATTAVFANGYVEKAA